MPKAKKVTKKRPSKKASEVTRIAEERATTVLTPDGHKLLVEELEELTAQRPEISDEIQRAEPQENEVMTWSV